MGFKGIPGVLLVLAGLGAFAGCNTTGGGDGEVGAGPIKDRGVYTTLAMPGHSFDMPGAGYVSHNTFGPDQKPAAVVVGYGSWISGNNQAEHFDLELAEMATGAVVFKSSGDAYAGRAEVCDLPIRKSGDYQLKLIMNGSVADTWSFSVTRDVAASTLSATGQPPVYAQGNFGASIEAATTTDAFMQYDDTLMQYIMNNVEREYLKADHDDFAQIPPGKVGVRFDLSQTGQVSSLQIMRNDLTDALGQFFLRAVQDGAPYPAWPADARAAFGSGTRSVNITFSYH